MQEYEGIAPWLFFTSDDHDPMLYGYRGLIVDWDYTSTADWPTGSLSAATTAFRLNGEDEASFPDEVDLHPDDFHRLYCPYRRLVGAGVVERFTQRASSTSEDADVEMRASSSLAEFVRRLHGPSYARDLIQPVYRPIAVPPTRHLDDRLTASDDDDDRCAAIQSQHVLPVSLTTTTVVVTSSKPLPVVPEASAEDWWPGGSGTEVVEVEPVVVLVNGERRATGNGDVDHDVCEAEPEVVDGGGGDDVRVNGPREVSTRTTTIVRHVNGVDVTNNDPGGVDTPPPPPPVNNGSVHRVVVCCDELSADSDVRTTPEHIIDEANRRTIRSDL